MSRAMTLQSRTIIILDRVMQGRLHPPFKDTTDMVRFRLALDFDGRRPLRRKEQAAWHDLKPQGFRLLPTPGN